MARRQGTRRKSWLRLVVWGVVLLALGPSLVNLPRVWVTCRVWETVPATEPALDDESLRTAIQKIPDYYRPESKTYLTLPEWYIVYSTDEYGAFLQNNRAGEFPHFKAVGQYWQSYAEVCREIRGRYPFNGDSQFTLAFIGLSFTAENMLKGAYEGTLGRLTEWVSSETPTEEEVFAAQVAEEYGAFMHMTPWYFFPFSEKLQELWQISLWGPDPLRKWERKLALTFEYGGKILYAGFTNLGAQAAYGGADVEKVYAVTSGVTDAMLTPDLEIVEQTGDLQLARITRFEVFSAIVPAITAEGAQLVEVAGNDEILFTLIGSPDVDYNFEHGAYLFDLPILTQPGLTRVAIKVPVADIGLFLQELQGNDTLQFEHMYDY
jgi:hypothetical protein